MVLKQLYLWLLALLVVMITVVPDGASAQTHLEFWRNNYGEVGPDDDSLVRAAHEVFHQVLGVAGRRPGVFPRLLVIPGGLRSAPMAMAIPDGGVVLSHQALQVCYESPELGRDRLAFVLGHEIAHQLKDDFWHLRFFEAIRSARRNSMSEQPDVLDEIREIAGATYELSAKELQADEHAVVYMTMAGYDPSAIVASDDNFFDVWLRSLDPARGTQQPDDAAHPSVIQRTETIRVRLNQVIERLDLFKLGLDFYFCGHFAKALACFEEFHRYFPSREVLHNIAACHHQLALLYRHLAGMDVADAGYILPLSVATTTRAEGLRSGGPENASAQRVLYERHISLAMEMYTEVMARDPSFIPAYVNAASGLVLQDRVFKAIGVLRDAQLRDSARVEVLNALGAAMVRAGRLDEGRAAFKTALDLDGEFQAARFNLGLSFLAEADTSSALGVWQDLGEGRFAARWQLLLAQYAEGELSPSQNALSPRFLSAAGVMTGYHVDEVAALVGTPIEERTVVTGEDMYVISRYSCGISTVSYVEEVTLIRADSRYDGSTSDRVHVGQAVDNLLAEYGPPGSMTYLSGRTVWLYDEQGLVVEVDNGFVTGWMLFL